MVLGLILYVYTGTILFQQQHKSNFKLKNALEPIPPIQLIQPIHQFLKTGVNICHLFHWPSMPTVLMTF